MKANILTLAGEKKEQIELPTFFGNQVREDIISKVFRSERAEARQPYGTYKMAGKRASAPGKIRHRRRAWKRAYGYGISRVPRKVMTRRGSRFGWVGAYVPGMVGGRKGHPSKPEKDWLLKINKKEQMMALKSAIAATTSMDILNQRYTLNGFKTDLPLVVERKIEEISKVKELKKIFYNLLKTDKFFPKSKVRQGKGKMRGRKMKKSAGLLLVVSKADKMEGTKSFVIREAKKLSVSDLAPSGQPGRLTIYSHAAIVDLQDRFKPKTKAKGK